MLFSSLTFICLFLPIFLLIYYISSPKYRNIIILIFSLLFYAWGEPKYIFLMIFSILINYVLAIIIDKYRDKLLFNKFILICSIIFNLSMLFFFKYINFTITNLNNLFGSSINTLKIILPIGISFYTFQILSYVIDVYKDTVKVQKNIINLGTYIALFPQLIAGPIVRYRDIEKQLNDRELSLDKFIYGIKRFIIGLSKKVIIANNVAVIVDAIYDNTQVLSYNYIVILIALLAYIIQLYFDFSGYSDMAIGLGKMLGFDFLENFDYPYASLSITEFWRRWHISLSSWFRDYIYIPLGGNRCSKIRWIFNIFIVWFLTGLWHGASWNYILWGLYFFILLILEKLIINKILSKLPKVIKWIYTFILINISMLIFRIEDINLLKKLFINIFTLHKGDLLNDIAHNYYLINKIPYIFIGFIFLFPVIRFIDNNTKDTLLKRFITYICLLLLFVICICFLIGNSYNPFIYFRF